MMYLAYIVLFFSVVQLLVVLSNLLFLESYNRFRFKGEDLVSILIPARNEENTVGDILEDVLSQHHRNIEVLVYDDQSEDATAALVRSIARRDARVRLIRSAGLPDGWLGKTYACNTMAQEAKGKYYLFVDADVRLGKNILVNTLGYMARYKVGLLSIFPRQRMYSFGEWMTVPLMNYILTSLLPLILVRRSGYPSLSAANGQYMLFDAQVYKRNLPHKQMRDKKAEDIAIAGLLKENKEKIACLLGDEQLSCRMYTNFFDGVSGFAKNIAMFFGNSLVLALLFWGVVCVGFVPVVFVFPLWVSLLYVFSQLLIRLLIAFISKQSVVRNMVYMLFQNIVLGWIVLQAFRGKCKRQYEWKGRLVS